MHQLINLPYAADKLEPYLDKKTVNIHYGKHHQGYIDKLNKAIKDTEYEDWSLRKLLTSLDDLPEELKTPVRHNGGGVSNHNLYFSCLSPQGGGKPEGELLDKIQEDFGSFENLKTELTNRAESHFGSGWAFLVLSSSGKLAVYSMGGHDTPLLTGDEPLLNIDVWEHAYYLKYQNRRAEYVNNWWELVNWEFVEKRFEEVT